MPTPDVHGGELTDERFWDEFWSGVAVPARPTSESAFDRTFSKLLDTYLKPDPAVRMVEIGCAPGRWMVHCHERFGFDVNGYESSPGGVAKTTENLKATGVPGTVHAANFLTADLPAASFDVVLSLGFIEHFLDPLPVVARHVSVLRPGGLLFLEVPNLRGLNLRLLRWARSPLLDVHNLEVMEPRVLLSLGRQLGLQTLHMGYLGGYEPSFLDLSGRSAVYRGALSLVSRARRWRLLDSANAPWLSGYICGVFRKRG